MRSIKKSPLKILKSSKGITLFVAILVMTILMFIIGAALSLSRVELKKTSNHKLGTQALEIADAGLQHALAVIPDGAYFDYTNLTQIFGSALTYPSLPGFTYKVEGQNIAEGKYAILTASAEHAASGTKKTILAYVHRGSNGYGAVHLEGAADTIETRFNGENFEINGNDRCGVKSAVSGITTTDPDLADEITNNTTEDGGLSSGQEDNVTGLGDYPSVLALGEPETSVSELADAFLADPSKVTTLGGGNWGGNEEWGTGSDPKIYHITGNARITGNLSGYGVIIVDSDVTFDISGNLTYDGLIIARGEVEITVTGSAEIHGSLLVQEQGDIDDAVIELDVRGHARIQYDSCALAVAFGDSKVANTWVPIIKEVKLLAWKERM
jgi:hypothetical protein